ncbi:NAD(P)-dependent dehydrogenase, short-chain alcohol dehydrogenase family [Stigmatella aurantiaca]|uniref:NAD(P)-dependent dehydrogenase, short-chain alcohol dehydrogenase family n=1 Tax=Stigmatella aurantiaca TaxID=41 RepID=A0A1H8FLY6_STIAU|nr:SDR family oxidoreductase [Stigmatella aurantiaca]SEN32821.1 NAD(P)-dependent dehydrogenase, short-chain alcohol dehydrogenase family [Stigmatella aurantiaca]
MRLKDKRIIVLGGSSGIGRAVAQAAAQEGASVVIGSRQQARVEQAVARLPRGTQGHAVDLSDEAQVRGFFERVGPFDHLVYTAGDALPHGAPGGLSLAQARQLFEVRFWGAYMAATLGSAHIRPGGSIVLTNGTVDVRPMKGLAVGSGVSGAIGALTRGLAVELAPLRVNTVSPGLIKTELWDGLSAADRERMYQEAGAKLPVGRVGEPEDVAQTYLYLMCQGFGTGQVLTVDGGHVLV